MVSCDRRSTAPGEGSSWNPARRNSWVGLIYLRRKGRYELMRSLQRADGWSIQLSNFMGARGA
jgi:hypothetical protein